MVHGALTQRSVRADWGLTPGSLNIHGHKSSIIRPYLVLCRNERSTILLTMFSLPFLSRRARYQVVHRNRNPLCLVTALLFTSQPSLRRLSSSVWLSTTHCKPDLSFGKLTHPLFLSSRFSRTWLPSNAKKLHFAMVPHCATYAYMWSSHICVHKVFPHPRSRCLAPKLNWRCSKASCSAPLRKSSF